MDIRAFLEELKRQPGYDGQVVYERFIPPRTARYAELNPPLPPALQESLRAQGIARLYSHQVEAVAAARGGTHLVVVTPTASGKTLCYNLPVLETLADDQDARALYLFPTKALAQDQADGLAEFGLPDLTWGTYDGDTPTAQRRSVREKAQIILTNPDMLHLGSSRSTIAGRTSSVTCTTWSSTMCTPTGECSEAMWPTSCEGCGGSAACMDPIRCSSAPLPRSPTPRSLPRHWWVSR